MTLAAFVAISSSDPNAIYHDQTQLVVGAVSSGRIHMHLGRRCHYCRFLACWAAFVWRASRSKAASLVQNRHLVRRSLVGRSEPDGGGHLNHGSGAKSQHAARRRPCFW